MSKILLDMACSREGCAHQKPEGSRSNRRYCNNSECKEIRAKESSAIAYARNKGVRVEQIRKYNSLNRESERERYHRVYRPRKFAKTYGISIEEAEALLAVTECDICHKEKDRMTIDHDHDTGKVRGRLCTQCNSGLGLYQDDPALLRAAAEYLERT